MSTFRIKPRLSRDALEQNLVRDLARAELSEFRVLKRHLRDGTEPQPHEWRSYHDALFAVLDEHLTKAAFAVRDAYADIVPIDDEAFLDALDSRSFYFASLTDAVVGKQQSYAEQAKQWYENGDLDFDTVIRKLSYRIGIVHAATFGTTELTRALSWATQLIGNISLDEEKLIPVWYTAGDERVCPICGAMHAIPLAKVPIGYTEGPPAHPNCRCWVVLAKPDDVAI